MSGEKRDCAHPIAKHQHGTRAGYQMDYCRCFDCRLANWRAKRSIEAGQGWREVWVPSVGVQRRLQALHALGWTWQALAERLGVSRTAVPNTAGARHRAYTTLATAQTIAALYDELSLIRPEGGHANRARLESAQRGFVPPLAWDDDTIDDPTAEPYVDEPETALLDEVLVERYIDGTAPDFGWRKPPERLEAIRRLAAKGLNDSEIGRRIRLDRCAVTKERERHGIPAGNPKETAA